MTVCLVGDPADLTTVYVGWKARGLGIDVLELNEAELGLAWSFACDDAGGEGSIEAHGRDIPLSSVQGIYVRLNPDPDVPEMVAPAPAERWLVVGERRAGLQQLLNQAPCEVVNRPLAGRSNGSKPYQMTALARAGLAVPRWIATNDPNEVRRFSATCAAGAIYKACSGLRSTVRRVDAALPDRLAAGSSPVVVQEYVAGGEVRLHVVGDRCFPTEVVSREVDHRFHQDGAEYRTGSCPDDLATRCVAIAAAEGLRIAGFDFRIDAAGRWWCLEMNPVPTFMPYEMATGQPIAEAILRLFSRC